MAQKDFNEIYLGMQDRIFRLAAGIVGSRADAEDIVQDLYEKLWRKRVFIATGRNPEGYILASARNFCLDRLRMRKKTTELPTSMPSERENCREDEKNMGSIVARLVGALPEKQRTAMHLRDIEGLEIDEIAKAMGINGTAVRMSLSRGRTTVKEQLLKIMNHGI